MLGLGVVVAAGAVIATALAARGPEPTTARLADPRTLVWTHTRVSPADPRATELRNLAWIGDRIVAIEVGPWNPDLGRGRGRLSWSLDGVTWLAVDSRIADVDVTSLDVADGVAWATAEVAAPVEPSRELWTSLDGTGWDRLDGATGLDFGAGGISRIVSHDGTLVARGWDVVDVEFAEQILLRSDEGRDWKLVRQPRGPSYGLRSVAAGAEGFVTFFTWEAGALSLAEAWHSLDGVVWTQHPVPLIGDAGNVLDATASDAHGYVAVGVGWPGRGRELEPVAWTSPNGRLWDTAPITDPSEPTTGTMELVLPAGSGFLAFGRVGSADGDRAAAWATLDGGAWDRLTDWPSDGFAWVTSATATPDRVVASGQRSGPDGVAVPVVWIGLPK